MAVITPLHLDEYSPATVVGFVNACVWDRVICSQNTSPVIAANHFDRSNREMLKSRPVKLVYVVKLLLNSSPVKFSEC